MPLDYLGVDKHMYYMLNCHYCPEHVPFMAQGNNHKNQNEELIKFLVPSKLKRAILELATERNITISSLLRLITSEYVKRTT
jgi:hypothetical protein